MGIVIRTPLRLGVAPVTGVMLAGLLTACGSGGAALSTSTSTSRSTSASVSTTTTSPTPYAATVTSAGPVDPSAVPLGDGYVSSSPKVGSVDSCVTTFPSIGGASVVGPWIDTATKTWDPLTKPAVKGAVTWPEARFSVTLRGAERIVTGNDLPIDHSTGTFPISPTDPAHAYDQNPNTVSAQSVSWSLPLDPVAAAHPSCLGLGPIGILDDGVYLFDALDGEGRDAGAHEVLDGCQEHPQGAGILHHHQVPSCLLSEAAGTSTLVGYAADGYGIYVERLAGGALPTNTDLDACHGRTSAVLWNGKVQRVYHYDATSEYPYTVGCYHGTPISGG
jgi:YHYH protein